MLLLGEAGPAKGSVVTGTGVNHRVCFSQDKSWGCPHSCLARAPSTCSSLGQRGGTASFRE